MFCRVFELQKDFRAPHLLAFENLARAAGELGTRYSDFVTRLLNFVQNIVRLYLQKCLVWGCPHESKIVCEFNTTICPVLKINNRAFMVRVLYIIVESGHF